MFKELRYKLISDAPLLMGNVRLANPLDPIVKQMKEITSKRKKTEDDLLRLMELEWEGGLYLDEKGRPCLPGDLVMGMLVASARMDKLGKTFRAGVVCGGSFPLEYDGPKTLDGLRADPRFRVVKMVTVQRAKILRTWPAFPEWRVDVVIHYHPAILNESQITTAIERGGMFCGFCNYRPTYGRFHLDAKSNGRAKAG